jgi:carboxymethylenebutenolidase
MSNLHETIQVHVDDGTEYSAYHARPSQAPRAGIVVLQEIFGVNAHIRRVADGYAEQGYDVLAPALFDRIERNVELGYDGDDMAKARSFIPKLGWDSPLADISSAVAQLKANGARKVGVVGYCWGGSLAYLSAASIPGISAAVGYYGSAIAKQLDKAPRVPTLLHFGETDGSIPISDIDTIRARHPQIEVHVYPAGHGFNCDARAAYSEPSAKLARGRSLAFFAQHLA